MKTLIVVFFTVLIAEIGDKTQIATMLYATDPSLSRISVFAAAAGALVVSSLIAVLAGSVLAQYIPPATLKIIAGIGFVIVGIWTLATVYAAD